MSGNKNRNEILIKGGRDWNVSISRRHFLKRTGGATVATLIAWNLSQSSTKAVDVPGGQAGSSADEDLEFILICLTDPSSTGGVIEPSSLADPNIGVWFNQRAQALTGEPDEWFEWDEDRSAIRMRLTGRGPKAGTKSTTFEFSGHIYGSESDEWNENGNNWSKNSDVTNDHDDSDSDDICAKGKVNIPPITLTIQKTGKRSYKVLWSPSVSKLVKLRCPLNRYISPTSGEAGYIADLDLSGYFDSQSSLIMHGAAAVQLASISGTSSFTLGAQVTRNASGQIEVGIPEVGNVTAGGGTTGQGNVGVTESLTVTPPSIPQVISLSAIWGIFVGARPSGSNKSFTIMGPATHENIVTYINETGENVL